MVDFRVSSKNTFSKKQSFEIGITRNRKYEINKLKTPFQKQYFVDKNLTKYGN
jgi:hypothetical protein